MNGLVALFHRGKAMVLQRPQFPPLPVAAVAHSAIRRIAGTRTYSLRPIRLVAGFTGCGFSFVSRPIGQCPSQQRSAQ